MDAVTHAQSLATHGAMEAWSFFLNFLVFLIIAGALFLFSYRYGRGPFLSLIASLYVGFAVYAVFPFDSILKAAGDAPLNTTVSSVILYIILTFVSYYMIRKSSDGAVLSTGNLGVVLLAFLTSGFLIALSYHTFAIQELYRFTPAIETYFAPAKYFFWWFIAPIVGVIALAR